MDYAFLKVGINGGDVTYSGSLAFGRFGSLWLWGTLGGDLGRYDVKTGY